MNKRNPSPATIKKYKRVVDEWFVNNFNGKKAYLKFYKTVTEGTATVNFSKLQDISEIKKYIDFKRQEAAKIVNTTHEGILKELVNWVSSDITETLLLDPEQVKLLPIEIKRLITKYKVTKKKFYDTQGNLLEDTEYIELHFVSKERAMEMINKHVGFYEVDNRQKATTVNILTANEQHKTIVQNIINGKS